MFTTFKDISKTVYITVLVILLGTSWFLFNAYTNGLEDKGGLKKDVSTLEQNVEHNEKSATITDTVVAEHVNDVRESQKITDTLRKEAVDDYINKIKPKSPVKPDDLPDGADRVIGLSHSLHENYCRARPQDTRCNPISPSK